MFDKKEGKSELPQIEVLLQMFESMNGRDEQRIRGVFKVKGHFPEG